MCSVVVCEWTLVERVVYIPVLKGTVCVGPATVLEGWDVLKMLKDWTCVGPATVSEDWDVLKRVAQRCLNFYFLIFAWEWIVYLVVFMFTILIIG